MKRRHTYNNPKYFPQATKRKTSTSKHTHMTQERGQKGAPQPPAGIQAQGKPTPNPSGNIPASNTRSYANAVLNIQQQPISNTQQQPVTNSQQQPISNSQQPCVGNNFLDVQGLGMLMRTMLTRMDRIDSILQQRQPLVPTMIGSGIF